MFTQTVGKFHFIVDVPFKLLDLETYNRAILMARDYPDIFPM
jgi:hypothetical protein